MCICVACIYVYMYIYTYTYKIRYVDMQTVAVYVGLFGRRF